MALIVRKMIFRNIGSFGNNDNVVDFLEGINVISGLNGKGKSTIIDALTFNFYGKAYRDISLRELINRKNKTKLFTRSYFEKDGSKYILERGMKPDVLRLLKDGVETDLKSTKALIQDEIDKIIGVNYTLFKKLISVSTGKSHIPFLSAGLPQKREMLESIFGLNVLGKMLKKVKQNDTFTKGELEILVKDRDLTKRSLEGAENQLAVIQRTKTDFERNKNENIKRIQGEIATSQDKMFNLNGEILRLSSGLAEIPPDNDAESSILTDEIRQKWILLSQTKEIDDVFIPRKLNFKHNIELFRDEKERLERLLLSQREVLARSNAAKTKFSSDLKHLNDEKSKTTINHILNTHQECLEIKDIISDLKSEAKSKEELKARLNSLGASCSYCGQAATEEHKSKELERIKTEQADLRVKFDALNESLSSISKFRREVELANIDAKIEKIRKDLDEENEVYKFAVEDETRTKELIEKVSGDITKVSVLLDAVDKERGEKVSEHQKKVQSEIDALNQKSAELKAYRDDREKKLKNNREIETSKSQISMNIDFLKTKILQFEIDLKKESEAGFSFDEAPYKKQIEDLLFSLEKIKSEIETKTESVKTNETLKKILDEDGIKKFFFSRLINKLNVLINQNLSYFGMEIQFSFNDKFEHEIVEFGESVVYECYSRGEQARINLSIDLAFMEINRYLNGFDCKLQIFDEVFDSGTDDIGFDLILQKMSERSEKHKMSIFIISHRDIVSSHYVNNILKIEKVNRFSKIEKNFG